MTKKILKIGGVILVSIVAVIALLITLNVYSSNTPKEKSDLSLGNLVNEMDGLRTIKQECLDNLNYIDTIKQAKGYTGYCDSWDGEIIELRGVINELQHKDYEDLVGLM